MKKILQIVFALLLPSLSLQQISAQSWELPIEVFRIKTSDNPVVWDNTAERTLKLGNFNENNLWLFLQVNNLNAAESMQYRIKPGNGTYGPWQTCSPNWTPFPKDKAYGGLGGGFGTTSFSTPITGAVPNDQNTIMFRFIPQEDDETSGYRIVEMAIRDTNNKNAPDLITTSRNYVSGANFEGPFAGSPQRAAMAQAGKELWEGTTGNDLLNRFGNTIQAKCTHCHTQNGSDLKYFNYSDKSIIARANFHGLSKEEGEQIAQYIRDLITDRSENGRPWEPPYQPGPDAENDPSEWAAGQGLRSVLEEDSDMLEELFGTADPSEEDIRNTIADFNSNTNLRTMKLSVQFPDWNMWLPEIHPIDQPDVATSWNDLEQAYLTLRNKLDTTGEVGLNSKNGVGPQYMQNGIVEAFGVFASEVQRVVANLPGSSWSGTTYFPNSPVWAENVNNNFSQIAIRREKAKRSISAWFSVKLFEIIEAYQLYDLNLANIPDTDEEFLEWPIREWTVFQNAAHITGANRNLSYFYTDDGNEETETRGIYLSSIWYQVQLTLTPGNRRGGQIEPNDYAYNLQHIHRLGAKSRIYEPVRFFQNYLKTGEQRNTGKLPKDSPWNGSGYPGWNMRELSPWRLYSTGRGDKSTFTALPNTTRLRLQEVFMDEVMEVLEGFGDDWRRVAVQSSARTDYELEQRGVVPLDGSDNSDNCLFLDRRGDCNDSNDAVEIDAFFTLLSKLSQDAEISCDVFNRIRDWATARWDYPASNWPTCKTTDAMTYELTVNNGSGNGNYAEGSEINIAANIPDGQVFDIWTGDTQYLANLTLANTQLTMPNRNVSVTATFKDPEPEVYTLSVENGNGSGSFTEGIVVNIMANIPDGKVFDTWTGDTQYLTNPLLANTQLTMPTTNVSVTATFRDPDLENYILAVNNGNGNGAYAEGTLIDVAANIPDGKVFDTWTGDTQYLTNPLLANTQLTMPGTNATITANFKNPKPNTYTLTVNNGNGGGTYSEGQVVDLSANVPEGQVFDGWTGDTQFLTNALLASTQLTMPATNIVITASFRDPKPNTYTLTVENGNGSGSYNAGMAIGIAAEIPEGTVFDTWIGDSEFIVDTTLPVATLIMPEEDVFIEATFKENIPIPYELELINGKGAGTYLAGTQVEIVALLEEGSEFVEWIGDIEYIEDPYSTATSLLMPSASIRLEAIVQRMDLNDLKIYPNPASQNIQIALEANQEIPVFINLWNLDGKLIRSQKIPEQQESIIISVADLQEAVYVLEFISPTRTTKKKIAVQR